MNEPSSTRAMSFKPETCQLHGRIANMLAISGIKIYSTPLIPVRVLPANVSLELFLMHYDLQGDGMNPWYQQHLTKRPMTEEKTLTSIFCVHLVHEPAPMLNWRKQSRNTDVRNWLVHFVPLSCYGRSTGPPKNLSKHFRETNTTQWYLVNGEQTLPARNDE